MASRTIPHRDAPDAPKYWKNEMSGQLAIAVRAYLDNPEAMTLREIAYMRSYLRQWIDSPAWDANPAHNDRSRNALDTLRADVGRIVSGRGIHAWLRAARLEGIDPL